MSEAPRFRLLLALALAVIPVVVGCDGAGDAPQNPPPTAPTPPPPTPTQPPRA